ncbi:MAG: quinolinate synthase NadA [Enterococcus sp.]
MNLLQDFAQQQIPDHFLTLPEEQLITIIQEAKAVLGEQLLLLAHHYQKDEIVQFADETGDSLQLAQSAAKNDQAEFIVFCGVHFMAETADMLTTDEQKVILPDLAAGCSMADMASGRQLELAWNTLQEHYPEEIIPITYINSTAEVKAFVGQQGGAIVTSSNAESILRWAFKQKRRVFFLPDQHLGRNTALKLGISQENIALWDPFTQQSLTELTPETQVILWNGWCSVHQQFTPKQIQTLRLQYPEIQVIVHPECPQEIVALSDYSGSTNKILSVVKNAPRGSHWAIGTDYNLVNRMKNELSDHPISFINPIACPCLTMNRIRLPHLAWCLENLANGVIVNQICVDSDVTQASLKALNTMLQLS